MDVMVAVGLFIVGVMLLYYFVGVRSESAISEEIAREGEQLPELLSAPQNESLGFITGGKVDREKLQKFANLSYNETRKALGITSDFCIYFEDEEGNIVNISGSQIGIGSGKAKISGIACGKIVCSDGTNPGACSPTQPLYCEGGTLVEKCSVCGCSVGTCQEDESCA
jgi:hypothetical protein